MTRFFVLGCQRSGTTLLRLILDSHPQIVCCDERVGYEALEQETPAAQLTDGSSPMLLGFKLPIWTELFAEYSSFFERFGREKIVFIQRDIAQVVASMIVLPGFLNSELSAVQGWAKDDSRSFAELCRGFDVASLTQPLTIDEKIQLAARYWTYKTSSYLGILRRGFTARRVYYRDLVLQPEATLRELIQFLDVPWHDDLLSHHHQPHSELDESGAVAIGGSSALRAIDGDSLNKYRRVLTIEQLEWLRQWEIEHD